MPAPAPEITLAELAKASVPSDKAVQTFGSSVSGPLEVEFPPRPRPQKLQERIEPQQVQVRELPVANCVEFMYGVMDGLYPELQGQYGDDTERVIGGAADALRKAYKPENLGQAPIAYNDSARRFVYLGLYATARASATSAVLNMLPPLTHLFERDSLSVCCVGGGPGTELIGIAKYLAAKHSNTRISATICDKFRGWESSWRIASPRLPRIEASYVEQDFACPDSWHASVGTIQADLYTLSYCLAEFRSRHADAEPYFRRLFRGAPRESHVLLLDINYSSEHEWFERIMQSLGYELLPDMYGKYHRSCSIGLVDREEKRAAERGYRGRNYLRASTDPKLAYRLAIKR